MTQEKHTRRVDQPGRAREQDVSSEILEEQVHVVDRLLLNEPMLKAPLDFADRVLTAILAGRQPRFHYERRQRMALGLALTVVILAPLMLAVILTVQHWLSDPSAFYGFLQQLVQQVILFLSVVSQTVVDVAAAIVNFITTSTVELTLILLSLPIAAMWLRMMSYTSQRRQVYRIPVQVL